MSFNSAVLNYERNETMLSGKHFKRKTMITAYESDVVPVVEEPLDPDLLYYWDFSSQNYTQEKVSKNPLFKLYEDNLSTFRPQVLDVWGNRGVPAGYNNRTIQANNNGSSFPVGSLDNISQDNLTYLYEYSFSDGLDLKENISSRSVPLFFIPNLCYKFGTTASSSDPDDPLQPSGIESSINSKDLRQFERAMTTDPTNPNFNIYSHRPAHYSFYNAFSYDHRTKAVQGVFPYCVSAQRHQLAFGYRTKEDGNKYFFIRHNKLYLEKVIAGGDATERKIHYNRHLPLITFREREEDGNCVLKYIKVFNRFLQDDEIENKIDQFPFLYHHIVEAGNYHKNSSGSIGTVITFNHVSYFQFNGDSSVYAIITTGFGIDMSSPVIWYEYELELGSSASTFAIEFFNNFANNSSHTNNYFNSSFSGLSLGVDGNQLIKYKVGDTISTTSITFPLNTKKYLSFAYTATEVKFYYDKTLIGTVLKSTDDSLWTHLESQTGETRFGVFNLGSSGNRAHFIVRHSFIEDRGALNNEVL
jgi:hypothetical protein